MSLYTIANDYLEAFNTLDAEEIGEEAVADTLEGLKGEFEDKAINVALYIKNLRADQTELKVAIEGMKLRLAAKKKKSDYLQEYLLTMMKATDTERVGNAYCDIEMGKLPDLVHITGAISNEFSILTPELWCPDKRKIKGHLDKGMHVMGAELITDRKKVVIK